MNSLSQAVSIHPYFKIQKGKEADFRAILAKFVELTATERTCLFYDFTLCDDQAFCRESYLNGDAALAHLENVGACIEEALTVSQLYRLEIHGPAAEIEKLRVPLADLKPDFYTHIAGVASFPSSQ